MPAHVTFDRTAATCTKTFFHPVGAYAFLPREVAARRIFSGAPWITPLLGSDSTSITMPLYAEENRLWNVAQRATQPEREELAGQVVRALHELWNHGYLHGDIQTPNIFVVDGQVKLLDFELFESFGDDKPPFARSFDIVGSTRGIAAATCWPSQGRHVHYYSVKMRGGIGQALGVPFDRALAILGAHGSDV